MGWDICSMGNHTLDTSDIRTLAEQLSEIFKINISCKAFKDGFYEEVVDFGEVVYDKKAAWFTLWDNFYFAKSLIDRSVSELQDMLSAEKIEEWYMEDIGSAKRGFLEYELYCDVENPGLYELSDMKIMKDFISISIMEPFHWFGFIDNLKGHTPNHCFFKFREKNIELYKKVGAKEIIYFPDQGMAQLILDKFNMLLWEEIKAYALEKKYYEDARKDFEEVKEYCKNPDKYLIVNLSKVLQSSRVYDSEDYIEILYDDMQDIY
jgi:hypothetical protein